MEIISRAAARLQGLKFYYTGKECRRGHISVRRTCSRQCLACDKDYKERNKEKIRAQTKEYRENNRDKLLAGKKDHYEKAKLDPEWQKRVRLARVRDRGKKKKYDIQYRQENREMVNKRSLEWSRRNPTVRSIIARSYKARRRAIEKDGDSTRAIHDWAESQDKVCYWCSVKCKDSYHLDHYHPLAKGGSHTIDNLVISCPGCNLRKNAKDPHEFAKQVGKLF